MSDCEAQIAPFVQRRSHGTPQHSPLLAIPLIFSFGSALIPGKYDIDAVSSKRVCLPCDKLSSSNSLSNKRGSFDFKMMTALNFSVPAKTF